MAQYTGLKSILTKLVAEIKTSFLDLSHPIGSYFWTSTSTFDPNESFGGSWERVKSKFIYAAGDDDTVGDTGGSKNVTLSTSNLPSHNHSGTTNSGGVDHTHTRGTMNITGKFSDYATYSVYPYFVCSGAFGATTGDSKTRAGGSSETTANKYIDFDASRNWTGATSGASAYSHAHNFTTNNTGSGNSFSIMPPYEVAYCWKRIS